MGFVEGGWRHFNRYAYTYNDPINKIDPTGAIPVETIWDAANVGLGAASFANNASNGNWGAAAVDAGGIIVDGLATIIPYIPGGAATGIKAARVGAGVVDSVGDAASRGRNGQRTYHRLESPTQSAETAQLQEASGEIWGRAPRGSDIPTVQAWEGPLPVGERGIEFMTQTPPSSINPLSGQARWRSGDTGVQTREMNGEDVAVIECKVIENRQC